jgi:hypothetical protein
MSRLWRRSRLWLQRLRLRRLRLGRLRFRRLLLIVGRLPSLLIRRARCWASTSEEFFWLGSGSDPAIFLRHGPFRRSRTTDPRPAEHTRNLTMTKSPDFT